MLQGQRGPWRTPAAQRKATLQRQEGGSREFIHARTVLAQEEQLVPEATASMLAPGCSPGRRNNLARARMVRSTILVPRRIGHPH